MRIARPCLPKSFSADIRFRGTVHRIDYLSHYEGAVIIVHFDPRFVAEIEVRNVDPPSAGIEPGIVHFAIHSPAQLFASSSAEGQTFNFLLHASGLLFVEW